MLLGVCLFLCINCCVEFIDVGCVLQEQVGVVLVWMDKVVDFIQCVQCGEIGELCIGLICVMLLFMQILWVIFVYCQQFLQVQLKLCEMNIFQQIDVLMVGELDVGLICKCVLLVLLMLCWLFSDLLVLVVYDQYLLVCGLFVDVVVVLWLFVYELFVGFLCEVGVGIYDYVIVLCCSVGFMLCIVQEVGEVLMLISLVVLGLGVMVLLVLCSYIQVDGVCFVVFSDCVVSLEVYVVCWCGMVLLLIVYFIWLLQDVSG